jgi:hypothetical protein
MSLERVQLFVGDVAYTAEQNGLYLSSFNVDLVQGELELILMDKGEDGPSTEDKLRKFLPHLRGWCHDLRFELPPADKMMPRANLRLVLPWESMRS